MNKILKFFFIIFVLGCAVNAAAGVKISKVDKADPNDEIFMSMAVDVARNSVSNHGTPAGAVVVLNQAFNATGIPSASASAEENAIAASRGNLANAALYTVNEPTSAAYLAICLSGVGKVVFANNREAVIAAGLAKPSDYEEIALPEGVRPAPMVQIVFDEATEIIKK